MLRCVTLEVDSLTHPRSFLGLTPGTAISPAGAALPQRWSTPGLLRFLGRFRVIRGSVVLACPRPSFSEFSPSEPPRTLRTYVIWNV